MFNTNRNPIFDLQKSIEGYLSNTHKLKILADFSVPDYETHGDITTNVALRSSKIISNPPAGGPKILAQEIVEYLKSKNQKQIAKIEIAGPGLINIWLSNEAKKEVVDFVNNPSADGGSEYGKNKNQKNKKWVIEHTSPNPNKAMHLGHLRNNLVGMSLANIIENAGGNVVRDAVDNNRGIAIAKAMYGYEWMMKNNPEKEKTLLPDVFISECYVKGDTLSKENVEAEKAIRQMVVDWENKDAKTWELWKLVLSYSYRGMERTLKRLGNKWDFVWHESDHYEAGKKYVEQGLQKGIFKKLEDGAILTQIEEKYGIPETILLKNDGTALYITQDIALTDLKKKKYKADKLIWVIGPEQSTAMAQMFAVCEQLGIGKREDFIHIPYGYMGLKDAEGNFKKMASRTGNVLLIDDIIDTVKETLRAEQSRIKDDEELLEKLAICAIKFAILKCERNQQMAFSVEESVRINGDSGIYVMYTYARIQSILNEAKNQGIKIKTVDGSSANKVVRELIGYPIIIQNAEKHYSAHPIVHYLLSLTSTFNSWYANEKILDNSTNTPEKLAILKAVSNIIEHGFKILGIEVVERM